MPSPAGWIAGEREALAYLVEENQAPNGELLLSRFHCRPTIGRGASLIKLDSKPPEVLAWRDTDNRVQFDTRTRAADLSVREIEKPDAADAHALPL